MIKKGSSVIETIDSLLAAEENFGFVDDDYPIMLVEGKDDKILIDRYYYHKNDSKNPFRVAVGLDFGEKVNGKKMAIKSYEEIKKFYSKVFVLIDRDFDYYLGENLSEKDPNIYYYDYYELENYLFEDSILKLYFDRYFECINDHEFEGLKLEFKKMVCLFDPFSTLSFIRELIYREKIENVYSQFQIETIASVASKNPSGVLQNTSAIYSGLSAKEKVDAYINAELGKVDLTYDYLIDRISNNEVASDIAEDEEDSVYFYKYLISGKLIVNSLNIIIEHFEEIRTKPKRSQVVLTETLKKEWIPLYSEKYSRLINLIQSNI